MKIPTRRVVRDGHEVTINVDDFDPAIHQEIAKEPELPPEEIIEIEIDDNGVVHAVDRAEPEPPRFSLKDNRRPAPEPEEEDGEEPFNLSECNVRDAAEFIEKADATTLDAFELEESTGHVRKGVLAAIEKRRAELEEAEE